MNQQQETESQFERRLRAELTAMVAERGVDWAARGATGATPARPAWRRRGPRLGLAVAAVAAIAAVALIVNASGGDTPAAFAVEAQPEGMVSVEISEISSPEDANGLEAALDEAGIPASVTYLAAGTACKEPRFRSVPWPEGARSVFVGPRDEGAPITFWISRAAVGPGRTLVVTALANSEGLFTVVSPRQVELAEGTVLPCEPVPVPPQ